MAYAVAPSENLFDFRLLEYLEAARLSSQFPGHVLAAGHSLKFRVSLSSRR